MDRRLLRIGDKIVSFDRLMELVGEILQRRSKGATQQEVAHALGLERSFVSHLEGLGEVRRGASVAVVGFPVGNKEEVEDLARECGVDFVFLLTEGERLEMAGAQGGAEIFNLVLTLLAQLKQYDSIVFLASDRRIREVEAILDRDVIGVPIGQSPITEDKMVDLGELKKLLVGLTGEKVGKVRRGRQRISRIFKKGSRGARRALRPKVQGS